MVKEKYTEQYQFHRDNLIKEINGCARINGIQVIDVNL